MEVHATAFNQAGAPEREIHIARPNPNTVRAIESASWKVRLTTGDTADWVCRAATSVLVMTAPVTIAATASTTMKIANLWSDGFIELDDLEVSHHAHVLMLQVVTMENIASAIACEPD